MTQTFTFNLIFFYLNFSDFIAFGKLTRKIIRKFYVRTDEKSTFL